MGPGVLVHRLLEEEKGTSLIFPKTSRVTSEVPFSFRADNLPRNSGPVTGQLDATDSYATASATWYDVLGRAVDSVDYGREDKLAPGSEDRYFLNSAGQLIASGNLPSVTVNPPQTPSASDTKNVTDYIVSQTVYDPDPSAAEPLGR